MVSAVGNIPRYTVRSRKQPGMPAIPCHWGGQWNTALRLHATEDEWTDLPNVLATAHLLVTYLVGAFKARAPSSSVAQEALSISLTTEHTCFRYKLDPHPDLRDVLFPCLAGIAAAIF